MPDLVPVSYPLIDTGMNMDLRFVYRNIHQDDEMSEEGSISYDPPHINCDFYQNRSEYSSDE